MTELREELVRKDQWYKFYRHYVEVSDVVSDRYAHEDGRDVLYLKGFNEEKRVVLAKELQRTLRPIHVALRLGERAGRGREKQSHDR